MSSFVGESDRKIVPRWRGFRGSVDNSLLQHVEPAESISASLQFNIEDWEREQTLWTALDVVGGAIVENRLDLAANAIHRLQIDPQTPPAALALLAEHERNSSVTNQLDLSIEQRCREQIRASRIRLAEYPYDAVEWIDLARSFTTLGSLDKAQRCIAVGLTLAPADVFVLRSSSRFYIQQHDPERAQWILTKAPRTLRNPWLLASEIAAASVAGRGSRLIKIARQLELADFRNEDLTELRAALATVELDAGSMSKGKKLLRRSLNGANENSLAQVQWLDRTRLGNLIDTSMTKPPQGDEAAAWRSFFEGKWENAAAKATLWFQDQPFSANAGIFCSYVLAGPANLPERALPLLKIAIQANADNATLKNNLAFTYIETGRLDEAATTLASVPRGSNDLETATLDATTGLLAFRRGLPEQGRLSYESAIKAFLLNGAQVHAGRAATFLALEEMRSRTLESPAAMARAFELTRGNERMDIAVKLRELQELAKVWLEDVGRIKL